LAYNTVVSIVRSASQKAQLVHNQEVQSVETEEVYADEMWAFVAKNRSNAAVRNANSSTLMLGVDTSECCHQKSNTTLARIKHSDWSGRMGPYNNKPDDGIGDRISLARSGNKPKYSFGQND